MRFILFFIASALSLSGTASAQVNAIAAGDVAAKISCDQAFAFQASMASFVPKPSPDEILTNAAVANKCTAEEYNLAQTAAGSDERVIAVATINGEGPTRSIAFDLVRISAKDEAQARLVCDAAGSVMGVVTGGNDPLLTPVLTLAGQYSCGSYLNRLISSSPLLIVAPMLIPGVAITKDVLVAIGVPRATVDKMENDLNRELGNAGRTVVDGTVRVIADVTPDVTIRTPRVTIPRCVRVMGRRICR